MQCVYSCMHEMPITAMNVGFVQDTSSKRGCPESICCAFMSGHHGTACLDTTNLWRSEQRAWELTKRAGFGMRDAHQKVTVVRGVRLHSVEMAECLGGKRTGRVLRCA